MSIVRKGAIAFEWVCLAESNVIALVVLVGIVIGKLASRPNDTDEVGMVLLVFAVYVMVLGLVPVAYGTILSIPKLRNRVWSLLKVPNPWFYISPFLIVTLAETIDRST